MLPKKKYKFIIRATSNSCRNRNLKCKKKKKKTKKHSLFDNKENNRLPSQLFNIVYEYLLETNETSEFLKNEGTRFIIGKILHIEPLFKQLPNTITEEENTVNSQYNEPSSFHLNSL